MLAWSKDSTPEELHSLLETLGEEYPISSASTKGIKLNFKRVSAQEGGQTSLDGSEATIRYANKTQAARAIGNLLGGLIEDSKTRVEQMPFETLGIMLDCSRNAVMKVEHFKKWLRRLALMGYNMAMLYTEDTYELEGEPYFGYQRGRYTLAELQEIDAYADSLGIEMISCFQTLGHLEQILRWSAYHDIRDMPNVALVNEPKTYELIDKMLDFWSKAFKSRRMHIGLDEAWGLGRGQYIDKFGFKPAPEILEEHVQKVVEACHKRGLEPMMWFDMYIRALGHHSVYDSEVSIPKEVTDSIPKNLQMVYWDYYHDSEQHYTNMVSLVRKMGKEPVMASGVWTWGDVFWHFDTKTSKFVPPCVSACRKEGVKEVFFTLWGDDGGFCEYDSSLAGLAMSAELAYCVEANPAELEKRFSAICNASYAGIIEMDALNKPRAAAIWDDPLQGIYWRQMQLTQADFWDECIETYEKLLPRLEKLAGEDQGVDFLFAYDLATAGLLKMRLRRDLEAAYADGDNARLGELRKEIPPVIEAMTNFMNSFRRQWMRRNKPQGLESIQRRVACVVERLRELDRRIDEYLREPGSGIPELDDKPSAPLTNLSGRYQYVCGGSVIA